MRNRQRAAGRGKTGANRLRNEIVGGGLLVTFMFLFLFAGFAYWQGFTILTEEGLKSLEGVGAVQEARVEVYVADGVEDLEMITSRPKLVRGLDGLNETGGPEYLDQIRTIVEASAGVTPGVDFIRVFDSNLDEVPLETQWEIEVPGAYLQTARTGAVTGLVVPDDSGATVHLIAGPVRSDEVNLGVVVIGQSTSPLYDLVADRRGLGETGETIIAQEHQGLATYIAPLAFSSDAVLQPIPDHIANLPMTSAVSGAELVTERGVDYRGHEVFAVTKHIDGPGWGLVVKKDRSEILAPLQEFAILAVGALILALVLAYWLLSRVTDQIVGPVRRVTETAKAIASGQRDLTVDSSRRDEIGELARSFDEMTTQLDTLTSSLEETVEERTSELRQKNAELARVMQDKETFLAGVSHEVRSPLTAMIGFLDLVNDAGDALESDERAAMLETVSRQADDVLSLIEDLLTSARVEAGTLNIVSVRCDVAAQVRQVLEAIEPSTRIDVQLAGEGAFADADPARVRQIIRNLLTNADRYGGSNVVVDVSRIGGVASVRVRDDGSGVPERDREEIFEPYGQSEANRRVDGSVGLGLHVSRELARLMGGDLIYDYVDGWSVFSLFLPEHYEESPARVEPDTVASFSG